ncbi:MAG: hypothetical protein EKK55_03540 [Rhodocyclaceae bacterium]|nr:MAG: hypothetical protein EKK55_03540 [Rhodocyclaceae bacterium]
MRRFAAYGAVLAFILFAVCGRVCCDANTEPPLVVTPSAMLKMFRDNPRKAAELYEGRRIMLAIRGGKYSILAHPPIIVSEPPPDFLSNYTIGVCRCRRDGVYTGDRCEFTIIIENAAHSD